jgi:hypothetical protein
LSYAVLPRDARRIKIGRPRLSGASVQKKVIVIPVPLPFTPLFKSISSPFPSPSLPHPHGEFISSAASRRRRNTVRVIPVGWCSGGDNVDEVASKSTLLRRRFLDGVRSCIAGTGARDRRVCCGGRCRTRLRRTWAARLLESARPWFVQSLGGVCSGKSFDLHRFACWWCFELLV